jgi:hypothetical protein
MLTMKLSPILAIIGFAAAMSAHAEVLHGQAQAAALLSSVKPIAMNSPSLAAPSVTSSEATDAQRRAADLLQRPLPSDTAMTQPQSITGAMPSAQDLARHLLDRRA